MAARTFGIGIEPPVKWTPASHRHAGGGRRPTSATSISPLPCDRSQAATSAQSSSRSHTSSAMMTPPSRPPPSMKFPSPSVRTPFGLLGERMVSPSDVPSGLACGCVCPGCGARLIARKGSVAWCFAHHGSPGTLACLETAIHAAGKQALLDANGLFVPRYEIEVVDRSSEGEITRLASEMSAARWVRFDRSQAEVTMPGVRPDVVGYRGDRILLVEIFVTHRVDAGKQRKLDELGLPALEIDLSDLPSRGAALGLEAVRQRVVDAPDHKRWMVYPGTVAAQAKLRVELAELTVERRRQAIAEAEAVRRREQQETGARMDRTAHFRALTATEKERRVAEALGITGAWPEHLKVERFDTPALGIPYPTWQAMLFDTFVCQRRGGADGFSVAEFEPWAREWIGIGEAVGRAPGPVLRGYAAFLAARGFLVRCETRGPGELTRYKAAPPIVVRKPRTPNPAPQPAPITAQHLLQENLPAWCWCDPWPRRAELYSRAVALLADTDHGEILLSAIDDLGPLTCPPRPTDWAQQLAASDVPYATSMDALHTLRLTVQSAPARRRERN